MSTAKQLPGGIGSGKIDHVVIIFKENHTFDNYFGTFRLFQFPADASPAASTKALTYPKLARQTRPDEKDILV
jgi:phospholipase C